MLKLRAKPFLFLMLAEMIFLSSCLPSKKPLISPNSEYNRGYQAAEKDYFQSQQVMADYIENLEKELALKTEKLRLFNLVDESGKLRTSNQSEPKKVKGNEPWQK